MTKKTFRRWEIDQVRLFPPSVRDFVPEGHLARLVSELVRDELDLSAVYAKYTELRGDGSPEARDEERNERRHQGQGAADRSHANTAEAWWVSQSVPTTKARRRAGLRADQGGARDAQIPPSRPGEGRGRVDDALHRAQRPQTRRSARLKGRSSGLQVPDARPERPERLHGATHAGRNAGVQFPAPCPYQAVGLPGRGPTRGYADSLLALRCPRRGRRRRADPGRAARLPRRSR